MIRISVAVGTSGSGARGSWEQQGWNGLGSFDAHTDGSPENGTSLTFSSLSHSPSFPRSATSTLIFVLRAHDSRVSRLALAEPTPAAESCDGTKRFFVWVIWELVWWTENGILKWY